MAALRDATVPLVRDTFNARRDAARVVTLLSLT
jgi:hypothetical protein